MPPRKTSPDPSEKKFDFSRSFQKLSWPTFQEFQHAYPNKEAISLYLYRLWPVIDRKLTGQPVKNIDVFPGPVSEEDLLRKHGSGKYLLTFNDMNRPKTMCKVAETKIDLNDHDYPPILDQAELVVGHRDNGSYIAGLRARGEWREQKDMAERNPESAATAELARVVSSVTERLLDDKQAPAQPADPFDQALKMISVLKDLSPKPAPVQQADPFDQALKLVTLIQPRQTQEDPLEVYARVTETVERIATRFDRPASSGGWSEIVLKLIEYLPAVMGGVAALRGSPVSPAAAPPSSTGVPAPIPFPAESPMPSAPINDLPSLFEVIKPFLLKAMTTGQTGDDFAAGVVTFVGHDKYLALASHGEEGLVDFLKQQQDIWPLLSPYEARVREFVADFLAYGQPDGDDDSDPAKAEVVQ